MKTTKQITTKTGDIIVCNILSETKTTYVVDSFGETPIEVKKEDIKELLEVQQ